MPPSYGRTATEQMHRSWDGGQGLLHLKGQEWPVCAGFSMREMKVMSSVVVPDGPRRGPLHELGPEARSPLLGRSHTGPPLQKACFPVPYTFRFYSVSNCFGIIIPLTLWNELKKNKSHLRRTGEPDAQVSNFQLLTSSPSSSCLCPHSFPPSDLLH